LFALISDDPKVEQYISAPPPSAAAFAGFIAWSHRERAAGKAVCFAVVPSGLKHAVGLFQVRALEPGFFIAEWGFALGSAFWSTGMFEEAAALVADFAFDVLGAHRIEGRAATANARGNGALLKIGAVSEAVLKRALEREGAYQEQLLWTIIREEWRERRTDGRERFSARGAERKIQMAIREVQAQLAATAPQKASLHVQLYPFFVGGRKPS
jgi:RimJ/RimL family protein N-acetyltransferase